MLLTILAYISIFYTRSRKTSRSRLGTSRSRSRLGSKVKRLGLVSVSDPNVSFTSLDYRPSCPGETIHWQTLSFWQYKIVFFN